VSLNVWLLFNGKLAFFKLYHGENNFGWDVDDDDVDDDDDDGRFVLDQHA